MKTTTIDVVIRDYELDHIDLIKMDCEGSEYEIIRSLSEDTFNKIDGFILEYHEGQQDLSEILSANNFEVHSKATFKSIMGYLIASRRT